MPPFPEPLSPFEAPPNAGAPAPSASAPRAPGKETSEYRLTSASFGLGLLVLLAGVYLNNEGLAAIGAGLAGLPTGVYTVARSFLKTKNEA